jgi:flagellar hook-length control protein FliK
VLASGGTQAFEGALKKALAPAPGAPAEREGETASAEHAVRQKLAGDGKSLPDSPEGNAEDTDEGDKSADIAFAWFGTGLVLPHAAPMPLKLPVAAKAIQLPEGQRPAGAAAPLPGTAQLAADPAPAPATSEAAVQDAATTDLKALAAPAADPEPKAPLPAATPDSQPAAERTAGPIRIELPPAQDIARHAPPITLASIQPRAEAIHAAAASIAPTTIETPSPRRQTLRETTISALTTLTTDAPQTHAVPATADAQQSALNLRSNDGMQAMVDRIEALRDTPSSRETSIRLSPDALGTVNISIRQEGDRVHVHFTADNAAARAALADAQPRLAELAESRGVRLGQTTVDGGTAGHGQGLGDQQRQDATQRPIFNTAPASAPGADTATDADERVA